MSHFSSDLSPTDPVQNMFNINRDKSLFNKSNATNTGYEELDFRDVKPEGTLIIYIAEERMQSRRYRYSPEVLNNVKNDLFYNDFSVLKLYRILNHLLRRCILMSQLMKVCGLILTWKECIYSAPFMIVIIVNFQTAFFKFWFVLIFAHIIFQIF